MVIPKRKYEKYNNHQEIMKEYLSSRRAKRAGWPKGLKGPEGAFRPFGPVGVLRRRLLH